MTRLFVLVLLVAGVLAPGVALAHPHIWIQQFVRVVAKDGKYTHVEIEWRFDPFSSEIEIPLIDEDHDGKISARELKLLVNDTLPLIASGGTGGYNWSLTSGVGSVTSNIYSAGATPGFATVTSTMPGGWAGAVATST